MVGDLRDQISGARSGLEDLVTKIPGYRGYKDREMRREADKLLRMHLARRFEEQRRRLNAIQVELTDRGRLASVVTLERAMMKLQLLIDRLRTASYGHAGLFDAIKIREKELDALYAFDDALAEGVDRVRSTIDVLKEQVAQDENPSASASELIEITENVNQRFSKRMETILEIGNQSEES